MTLDETIAALAAATEGSRELDAAMAVLLGVNPQYEGDGIYGCPRYTTSLDAAYDAVPSGLTWRCEDRGALDSRCWASLCPDHGDEDDEDRTFVLSPGPTPALALCRAILQYMKVRGE